MNIHKVARGLGWFSIGLGLAEVAATRKVARAVHLEDRTGLVRGCGMRELATGIGILSRSRRAPWLWARVAGDVMDLVTVGGSFKRNKGKRGKIAAAAAAVAGVTALDVICGRRLGKMRG